MASPQIVSWSISLTRMTARGIPTVIEGNMRDITAKVRMKPVALNLVFVLPPTLTRAHAAGVASNKEIPTDKRVEMMVSVRLERSFDSVSKEYTHSVVNVLGIGDHGQAGLPVISGSSIKAFLVTT
jgi:hypothetical protein